MSGSQEGSSEGNSPSRVIESDHVEDRGQAQTLEASNKSNKETESKPTDPPLPESERQDEAWRSVVDPNAPPFAKRLTTDTDLKKEHPSIGVQASLTHAQVQAMKVLEGILHRISALDGEGWFQRPVTEAEAPKYHTIIKEPMCFQVRYLLRLPKEEKYLIIRFCVRMLAVILSPSSIEVKGRACSLTIVFQISSDDMYGYERFERCIHPCRP